MSSPLPSIEDELLKLLQQSTSLSDEEKELYRQKIEGGQLEEIEAELMAKLEKEATEMQQKDQADLAEKKKELQQKKQELIQLAEQYKKDLEQLKQDQDSPRKNKEASS